MYSLIIILHIMIAIALIGLVLMNRGKGTYMGAAFGSGASQTLFGSQGSTPFIVKLIGGLAIIFFVTSLTLGYFTAQAAKNAAAVQLPVQQSAPAIPAVPDSNAPAVPPAPNN
jgi:preprotein translocase subunit SecG